ncbi:Translocon-associated domain containing protein [Aphelenchoides bicaudatus]|nr:Translocon-associated domain containing protein [Aphelenchoides bicaudatus]
MLVHVAILALFASVALAGKCESPKYSSSTFSTNDAFFHYHTTYVAEFALQCSNNVREVPFYAVIGGKEYGVAVSEETARYQVSWSLPNEKSGSQTFDIKIYDEDRFEDYQRAIRDGGDGSNVQPLFTINHYHGGVAKKFPLSSETVALLVSILALYFASNFKTELKLH